MHPTPPPPGERPTDSESAASAFARRLAFLELDVADAERLRRVADKFADSYTGFLDGFYGHLRAFPATARFLDDPVRFEHLRRMQEQHFRTLLEARWDDFYVAGRRRVGDAHADGGVEPEYFLGAYVLYLRHAINTLEREVPDATERSALFLSLLKAVFLDIGLTLDAYFAQTTVRLRNALDMLWRANQELRHFAQLTTHDLKTPLATVANLCDEAVDEFGEAMPPEARKLIASARQASFRMSAMIDELLGSAMSGPITDGKTQVDLERICLDAVERVRPQLAQKGLVLELPNQWPVVWANKIRLREALYNLLSNASKFVRDREGRIEVRAETHGHKIRISVHDNGPGIPKEELERIFVPFRRLPAHRDLPGSGLGLYFTKNLIESEGGRVWCESQPGQGATFLIELDNHADESRTDRTS